MTRGRDKFEMAALLPGKGQNKGDTSWRTAVNAGVDSITGWNPHDYLEPFQSPARVAAAANNVRNAVGNMMGGSGRTESTPYQDILQAAMNYAPRVLSGAAGVVDRMPAAAFSETTGMDPIDPTRIREGAANAWNKYGSYLTPFLGARANPNMDVLLRQAEAEAWPALPSMVNEAVRESVNPSVFDLVQAAFNRRGR